jgi:4-hydroxybenzoate polyprenyltransferase
LKVLSAAGHLAVWAGLYVAAAVVCFGQLIGGPEFGGGRLPWGVIGLAWATATAVYLLDRVKLRDAWLDPADREAHPGRFAFLAGRARGVRLAAAVLLIVSAAAASRLHPLGPLVALAAVLGVLAYAGRPRRGRARIKDVLLLKNAFVAAGIAGFAGLMVIGGGVGGAGPGLPDRVVGFVRGHWALLLLAASHVALRVFADAVLCDIDDEHSDRRYETATLPTLLGGERAWVIAAAIRLGLAATLLLWPAGDRWAQLLWAGTTAVSTVGLWLWHPRSVRDPVDARFALEAAVVAVGLALIGRG